MRNVIKNIEYCMIICGSMLLLITTLGLSTINIVTSIGLFFLAIPLIMYAFETVLDDEFNFSTVLFALSASLLIATGILLI